MGTRKKATKQEGVEKAPTFDEMLKFLVELPDRLDVMDKEMSNLRDYVDSRLSEVEDLEGVSDQIETLESSIGEVRLAISRAAEELGSAD